MKIEAVPPSKFCVVILTHGRADNVITVDTLRKDGCTSEIILIIDDEDDQAEDYIERFEGKDGCKVRVFPKEQWASKTDTMDTQTRRDSVVFARNASWDIVKAEGYDRFLMFEDDYRGFAHRFIVRRDGQNVLRRVECTRLDEAFGILFAYMETDPRIRSVCLAQAGDFIGGWENYIKFYDTKYRKAMNTFHLMRDRHFTFFGRMNDDVNTYLSEGVIGGIFFTFREVMMEQELTQVGKGGNTEQYLEMGTYVKSFYSLMCAPSCVKISTMGWHNHRVHHKITWNNAVPRIISSKYRKGDTR